MSQSHAKHYIYCAIMVALTFGIGMLPPIAEITPLGMKVLGIFVGTVFGWCTLGLLWPSMYALVILGSTGFCTVTEAFSQAFGNSTPLILISVFVLAAYLEESGLSQYIANWFISRKIGEGRPWVFTFLICAAAYILSAFVSLYATIVIIWTIFYRICDSIGVPRKSSYASMVIAIVVIISSLTGMLFPFKAFSQISYGLIVGATGIQYEVNFLNWFLFNLIISLVLIALFFVMARLILKPDMEAVKKAGEQFAYLRNEKMNKDQRIAIGVLCVFILIQVIPSFLPTEWAFVALLQNWAIIGGVTVCMIFLSILRRPDGSSYVHIGKLISKGTNWDIVVLLGAIIPLSAAMEAEETGVMDSILGWLSATLSGFSGTMFLVVVVLLFLTVTQFTNNMLLMTIFIPVLSKLGLDYGIHPFVIANLIHLSAQSAFLMPGSSSQAAMIYGNTEWVSKSAAFKYDVGYIVIAYIVLIGLGIPLAQLLF